MPQPSHDDARYPVAVVIPTWNSSEDIAGCLARVIAAHPRETVVIDNGSTDDTIERVRVVCPSATVIPLEENHGFSHACNVGIAATVSPWVLILNADARLGDDYLAKLLEVLEARKDAASATGKLLFKDRDGTVRIDSAGIQARRYALSPLDRGHGQPDVGQHDAPTEIFGPSATAALYRREALDSLHEDPFDPELFAYYEDVDLAWRLRRRGWRHLYVPATTTWHRRRGPAEKPSSIARHADANRYVVFAKNLSTLEAAVFGPMALVWESMRIMRRAARRPAVIVDTAVSVPRIARTVIRRLVAAGKRY